jgi:heptosyltransferase-2
MVMAQSLFISLKQQYPDCEIDVLAPGWSLPVLDRMPEVNMGIASDLSHGQFSLLKRYALGRQMAANGYSHAIVLPRSWKSALMPFFAGIPVRTGYRGEMRYGLLNDIRELDRKVLTQTVQRYVALGKDDSSTIPEIPFPQLKADSDRQAILLQQLGLKRDKPVACMMPGAEYGPAKQWPIEYYGQLAVRLVNAGWQVWIMGSGKDSAAGDRIWRFCPSGINNLCGQTGLADAIDLLSIAKIAVTNDSGLMHVAAAVGVHVYVIYGSSTPVYTPPLTEDAGKTVFYLGLDCSPCFERRCPLGHYRCLNEITDEEVFASIHKPHQA